MYLNASPPASWRSLAGRGLGGKEGYIGRVLHQIFAALQTS